MNQTLRNAEGYGHVPRMTAAHSGGNASNETSPPSARSLELVDDRQHMPRRAFQPCFPRSPSFKETK